MLGTTVTGGSIAHAQQTQVTANKKVLYVTRLEHRDRTMDDKVRAYLEKRGMTVTMVDESTPSSAARGEDLVIISSVVSARDMAGGAFKEVSAPLAAWG